MALDALKATPIFAEVPLDHLEALAAQAEPMSLKAGDFLIVEGDRQRTCTWSSPASWR